MYTFMCKQQPLVAAAASVEAAIKDEENYEWFTYNGAKPVTLDFRGQPVQVARGQRFGVRPSVNKKDIRLIFPNEPTRVHTLTLDQAKALARGVSA